MTQEIWEIDEKKPTIEGVDAAGRPDPAYAAALGLRRAPFGRRALAAACDGAIWLLLQLPLWLGGVPLLLKLATGAVSPYGFLNHPDFTLAVVMAAITVLLTLVFGVVQLILHGRKGVTVGKAVAGIRTVNVRTLERPGVGPVLLRFLMVSAAGLIPLLAPAFLISPTFDPQGRGRGWHDKATNVWLVDVRKGLHPYDEKRMRVARKAVKAEPVPERAPLPSLATPVDPGAQPEYRPGSRLSAGVVGVARPHDPRAREASDRPSAPVPSSSPASPVVPVVPAAPASAPAAAPVAALAPAPQPAPAAQPAPAGQPAVVQSPASAPAPAPQPAPAPAPQPAQAPAPQGAPAVRFGLRFDTGDSIPIAEPVLLGRNPDAAQHPGARPIPLPDETRSLSKTHLLVRPVEGGLEVVDCRSTNGSGLIRGGTEYGIAAGRPIVTTEGDMIRLGDRVAAVVRMSADASGGR
ncbi:RDD family protein [Microbacterium neungamense]|uniref:RDD family protein n=1 Tax=Microbacterium neungamense TaxID=2810535 RepID=UPI00217E9D10|nr:RDD family protein [Microbacterium neungamense]UWF77724.1 RDD family protein [Microbacterium neungamense]